MSTTVGTNIVSLLKALEGKSDSIGAALAAGGKDIAADTVAAEDVAGALVTTLASEGNATAATVENYLPLAEGLIAGAEHMFGLK